MSFLAVGTFWAKLFAFVKRWWPYFILIACLAFLWGRFSSLKTEIQDLTADNRELKNTVQTYAASVDQLNQTIDNLFKIREADAAAIEKVNNKTKLARIEADKLRAEFNEAVKHDERAQNFIDQLLPDVVCLRLKAGSDQGSGCSGGDAP